MGAKQLEISENNVFPGLLFGMGHGVLAAGARVEVGFYDCEMLHSFMKYCKLFKMDENALLGKCSLEQKEDELQSCWRSDYRSEQKAFKIIPQNLEHWCPHYTSVSNQKQAKGLFFPENFISLCVFSWLNLTMSLRAIFMF